MAKAGKKNELQEIHKLLTDEFLYKLKVSKLVRDKIEAGEDVSTELLMQNTLSVAEVRLIVSFLKDNDIFFDNDDTANEKLKQIKEQFSEYKMPDIEDDVHGYRN